MNQSVMDLSTGRGKEAREIAETLSRAGYIAYFAGGCVRDFLMGKKPQDFDIATSATPDQIEELFPRTVPVGKQFGVILVIGREDQYYEVATFRKEGKYEDGRHPDEVSFADPEQDALRRDFTVNGIFYDPLKHEVLDYVQGRADIDNGIIKAIGDPYLRFEEDKLRLLRAVRFASTLNFEIEPATWQALTGEAVKISCVSAERIREEISKIICRPRAGRGLSLLYESHLLQAALPEIAALADKKMAPGFSPDDSLLQMTGELLDQLNTPSEAMAFAALFYYWQGDEPEADDIEKAEMFSQGQHTRISRVEDILKRLKSSNEIIDGVKEVLKHQKLFFDAAEMREGALKMFLSRDSFHKELELHIGHCRISDQPADSVNFIKAKLRDFEGENLKPEPLLNGHDLIELGVTPGPKMKPILDEAYLLQLEGEITDRGTAMNWAKGQI